jgi:predicted metal-dependent phosphoesterase TrpH
MDTHDKALTEKLEELRGYRRRRAERILENVNQELSRNGLTPLDSEDLKSMQSSAGGAFGRPHIAGYLVRKGIVRDKQEAFDRYLVKCNVPKMPISLEEASTLVRNAGGMLLLAHPNDPNGTSLMSLTRSIEEQHRIIRESMLPFLDGVECWHSRHDAETASEYFKFACDENLLVSGGSDCHQDPVILGTVEVPSFVHEQFDSL